MCLWWEEGTANNPKIKTIQTAQRTQVWQILEQVWQFQKWTCFWIYKKTPLQLKTASTSYTQKTTHSNFTGLNKCERNLNSHIFKWCFGKCVTFGLHKLEKLKPCCIKTFMTPIYRLSAVLSHDHSFKNITTLSFILKLGHTGQGDHPCHSRGWWVLNSTAELMGSRQPRSWEPVKQFKHLSLLLSSWWPPSVDLGLDSGPEDLSWSLHPPIKN